MNFAITYFYISQKSTISINILIIIFLLYMVNKIYSIIKLKNVSVAIFINIAIIYYRTIAMLNKMYY